MKSPLINSALNSACRKLFSACEEIILSPWTVVLSWASVVHRMVRPLQASARWKTGHLMLEFVLRALTWVRIISVVVRTLRFAWSTPGVHYALTYLRSFWIVSIFNHSCSLLNQCCLPSNRKTIERGRGKRKRNHSFFHERGAKENFEFPHEKSNLKSLCPWSHVKPSWD